MDKKWYTEYIYKESESKMELCYCVLANTTHVYTTVYDYFEFVVTLMLMQY